MYLISHIAKTVCAYNLSTEFQHFCIFLNAPEAETTIKAVIWLGTLQSVATPLGFRLI